MTATVKTDQEVISVDTSNNAYFEHIVHGMHENVAATELFEHESEEARGRRFKRSRKAADRGKSRDFSYSIHQRRLLAKYHYNDNPATWGPSPFAIASGLADYQIAFKDEARETMEPISPKCMKHSKRLRNGKTF